MKPFLTPMEHWANTMQAGLIMAEANMIVAMRLWGMAGLWSVTPFENTRMVREKAAAFQRAAMDAGIAAATGGDVAKAAMRPIRNTTRANAKRLVKRGPKLP
ncbi:antifreeze protein [uncultured Maritimibacter sp.]|jgi:hypothetical protein|uniref:antifreeze protein n=1 Tax=uncultured Maritimibacter sp. TaxID=991866 RepID=UPI00262BECD0|nr:antifreeze protein [uncultured Maritimibacter sp.]